MPFKLAEPITAQLAATHTLQGCIAGESMATCVNFTYVKIEVSLPRQKAKTTIVLKQNIGKNVRL